MEVSTKNTAAVQATRQPTQIQRDTQRQAQVQERAKSPEANKPPTPVLNTQGQTTGRLVNVTA